MEKYGFFKSSNKDRVYQASDIARILSRFFTTGIFDNSFIVSPGDGASVNISPGMAFINGYCYESDTVTNLPIDVTGDAYDAIVLRLDLNARKIGFAVVKGDLKTSSSDGFGNFIPTDIIRNENVFDLRLANLLVSANITKFDASDIEDTRYGSECGNVVQAVQTVNTADLFDQYTALFYNWFSQVKSDLSSNATGNLENRINDLNDIVNKIPDGYAKYIEECFNFISTWQAGRYYRAGKDIICDLNAGTVPKFLLCTKSHMAGDSYNNAEHFNFAEINIFEDYYKQYRNDERDTGYSKTTLSKYLIPKNFVFKNEVQETGREVEGLIEYVLCLYIYQPTQGTITTASQQLSYEKITQVTGIKAVAFSNSGNYFPVPCSYGASDAAQIKISVSDGKVNITSANNNFSEGYIYVEISFVGMDPTEITSDDSNN